MPVKSNIISVIITLFLLTSCQRAITSPTKESTAIPSTITLTPTITITLTSTPRFLPENVGFEMDKSVTHEEPTLVDMKIDPKSGKSVREELLDAGVTEETIALYENAGYAWALASGFDESAPVTVEEIANGLFGNNFHWQMVFRSLDSGNILWAQSQDGKKYNLFPTIVKVDLTGVHRDPAWKAVELPDTKDAKVIFVNGVYPVAVRIPVTGTDRNEYYSEWFNTLAGEWEKDTAVEAIPKVLEYYKGLMGILDRFTLIRQEDLQVVVQDILDHPMLTEPQPLGFDPIIPYVLYDFTGVVFQCIIEINCKVSASVRIADPVNGPDRWYLIWEIQNHGDDHSHVVVTYIGDDVDRDKLKLFTQDGFSRTIANNVRKGMPINIFVVTKRTGSWKFTNPVLAEIIDHQTPENRKTIDEFQKTLKIPDSLSKTVLKLGRVHIRY
jgi:hypothetical protein